MRVPACLRAWWLGCELRMERDHLSSLIDQESLAQIEYVQTQCPAHKSRMAHAVADLARAIACTRGQIAQLRRRIARLRSGLPEGTS